MRTDKQASPPETGWETVKLARRPLLLGSATALGGLALGTGLSSGRPALAQTPTSSWGKGPLSGLPWHSGAALLRPDKLEDFARFRGRPADTVTFYTARDTWEEITRIGERSKWLKYRGPLRPERLVLSFAWLPKEPAGFAPFQEDGKKPFQERWEALADALGSGSEDDCEPHWAKAVDSITKAARDSGHSSLVVRVGWEFSGRDWPWSSYEVKYAPAFRKMWARCATILKDNSNGVEILTQWDPLRRGRIDDSIDRWYPEDDRTVDLIGVDYYDGSPAYTEEKIWDRHLFRKHKDGPWGLGAWFEYAIGKGKKLVVAEWGVSKKAGNVPHYVRGMHAAFTRYRDALAYENLFEMFSSQHEERNLSRTDQFTAARDEYLKHWSVEG